MKINLSLSCLLPWYNCAGWLGVKHQFTYSLVWCIECCCVCHQRQICEKKKERKRDLCLILYHCVVKYYLPLSFRNTPASKRRRSWKVPSVVLQLLCLAWTKQTYTRFWPSSQPLSMRTDPLLTHKVPASGLLLRWLVIIQSIWAGSLWCELPSHTEGYVGAHSSVIRSTGS